MRPSSFCILGLIAGFFICIIFPASLLFGFLFGHYSVVFVWLQCWFPFGAFASFCFVRVEIPLMFLVLIQFAYKTNSTLMFHSIGVASCLKFVKEV